jgi:hypothetical protein
MVVMLEPDRSSPSSPDPSAADGSLAPRKKLLGGYLLDAGLLTQAQIDVALQDQKMTGLRLGEVLAARGWVKQETIDYLMEKVVLPEQEQQAAAAAEPRDEGFEF